jgi:hypothetical protein
MARGKDGSNGILILGVLLLVIVLFMQMNTMHARLKNLEEQRDDSVSRSELADYISGLRLAEPDHLPPPSSEEYDDDEHGVQEYVESGDYMHEHRA